MLKMGSPMTLQKLVFLKLMFSRVIRAPVNSTLLVLRLHKLLFITKIILTWVDKRILLQAPV